MQITRAPGRTGGTRWTSAIGTDAPTGGCAKNSAARDQNSSRPAIA